MVVRVAVIEGVVEVVVPHAFACMTQATLAFGVSGALGDPWAQYSAV